MTARAKALFIALDSADKDLLLEWSDEGLLPNLRRLREQGSCGVIVPPPGFGAGDTIWRLFNTGIHSAQHVRFADRLSASPATAPPELEPFWVRIAQAGCRIAVIDIPNAGLIEGLKGIQLLNWGVHEPYGEQAGSWPPELAAEIGERFVIGPDGSRSRGSCCDGPRRDSEGYREFRDRLLAQIERKTAFACRYLDQGDWDLFMTGFSEAHCAGHQCWHLHDPSHPWHEPALAASVGDPIKEVYVALDAAVGRFLAHASPETRVFVYACPGMGPAYNGNHLLDEILRRLDGPTASPGIGFRFAKSLVKRARWLSGRLPAAVKPLAANVYRDAALRDRSRRRCFQVRYHDEHGAIRISVTGRDPNGRINEGQEYEQFCSTLIHDLLQLIDPDTARPIIANVLRTDRLFPGQRRTIVPDLLVEWNMEAPISSVWSAKTGTIRKARAYAQHGTVLHAHRSGDHHPHGLFMARGPGLAPGGIPDPVSVLDFAPTLAELLGVRPAGFEGKSIAPLLCTASQA